MIFLTIKLPNFGFYPSSPEISMKHRASFPPIGWTPLQVGTLISFWLLCFRFRNRGPSQTRRYCTAMPSARAGAGGAAAPVSRRRARRAAEVGYSSAGQAFSRDIEFAARTTTRDDQFDFIDASWTAIDASWTATARNVMADEDRSGSDCAKTAFSG